MLITLIKFCCFIINCYQGPLAVVQFLLLYVAFNSLKKVIIMINLLLFADLCTAENNNVQIKTESSLYPRPWRGTLVVYDRQTKGNVSNNINNNNY